ncbi:MAG TPA: 30S ribosomal protein S2, partial [Shewanella sp.]|nr:30S ribosomal protein S2 [Shewanella sp.]
MTHVSTHSSGCPQLLYKGSKTWDTWRSNPLNFKVIEMTTVSMRDMLQAGVHFGHQTRY